MGLGNRQVKIVVLALLGLLTLAPLSVAQDMYVEPRTQDARDVKSLFDITLYIALFVFVFVEGLLLYVIFKFRRNKTVPANEGERGHHTAEIVWTVIPAVILLFIGFLSAGTLIQLDDPAENKEDFTVRVEAFQWGWQFIHPDANGTLLPHTATPAEKRDYCRNNFSCVNNEMWVEEGSTVRIEVVSRDVIHAIWIPEFAVKLDASPGRVNQQWFTAPAVASGETDDYLIYCAEFCGSGSNTAGHHSMCARLVVFKDGAQPTKWGRTAAQGDKGILGDCPTG